MKPSCVDVTSLACRADKFWAEADHLEDPQNQPALEGAMRRTIAGKRSGIWFHWQQLRNWKRIASNVACASTRGRPVGLGASNSAKSRRPLPRTGRIPANLSPYCPNADAHCVVAACPDPRFHHLSL